jgi:hypothetical protein
MKIRAFVMLATLFSCALLLARSTTARSLSEQTGAQTTPAPSEGLVAGNRMVQAVQYPYDQKVKFDHLVPTGRVKGMSGSAEVLRKKNGIQVEVDIDGPPASQLKPEYKGYVVWAVTPDGKFTNLGAIDQKGAKGMLKTTTTLPAFGIVVGAEADLKATSLTDAVLENVMPDAKRRMYPIYRVYYKPAVSQ